MAAVVNVDINNNTLHFLKQDNHVVITLHFLRQNNHVVTRLDSNGSLYITTENTSLSYIFLFNL